MSKTLTKILTMLMMIFLILIIGVQKTAATDDSQTPQEVEALKQIEDIKRIEDFNGNFREYLEYVESLQGDQQNMKLMELKSIYSDNLAKMLPENKQITYRAKLIASFIKAMQTANLIIKDESDLWNKLKTEDGVNRAVAITDAELIRYKNLLCRDSSIEYASVMLYKKSGKADVYVYDDDPEETAKISDADKLSFHPGSMTRTRSK